MKSPNRSITLSLILAQKLDKIVDTCTKTSHSIFRPNFTSTMKKNCIFIVLCIIGLCSVNSQHRIKPQSAVPVAQNLDMKAVATALGLASSIDDFERKLNDPGLRLNNMDLDLDKKVDFLRVVEIRKDGLHQLIIESVSENKKNRDIATILIDKGHLHEIVIQIIGNPGIYGSNYITAPLYPRKPQIVLEMEGKKNCRTSTWGPGNYPRYFKRRTPDPIKIYQTRMLRYRNNASRYNRFASPLKFYSLHTIKPTHFKT